MSEEIKQKTGPNVSDDPIVTPEESKTFSYDVASQVSTTTKAQNPNSPLAAG
jgi:hypothetical protein